MTVAPIGTADLRTRHAADPAPSGAELLERAKRHAELGEDQEAFAALGRLATADRSFTTWSAAERLRRQVRSRSTPDRTQRVRLALVGTTTIDQLGDLLGTAGLAAEIDLEVVHVAGYGQYETALLDPNGPLYAARPDVIVLAPDATTVRFPTFTADPQRVLDDELVRWTNVWSAIASNADARVLQLNFVPPFERPAGSLEGTQRGSRRNMFHELNLRLAEEAGSRVQLVDAAAVASSYGLSRWWDDRYWFRAKQAVSLGAVPELASEIAAVLRARFGRTRKCLVIDLDDTLWGGVVGDDGVENLQLDGTAVGEAHLALQDHLLDLQRSGVVLAVCSKNDDAWARAPFHERHDMRIGIDDFAAFVANWDPKTDNLRRIADQLDLGLDSFVFFDDNPAERALVREVLPEVDVIELPDDPSGFRRALADYRGFEPAALTAEDAARTEQYRGRAAAFELREQSSTVEEFLEGLGMVADVAPFDAMSLPRVAQLVGKTNQWNLTTRRHPIELLERWADDPDVETVSVRLSDRYTDHGIVAVAVACESDDALEIDTFLMSCRVIGRTVEQVILDHLVDAARERGLGLVRGRYIPTPKNGVVRDLYERLGFAPAGHRDTDHHDTGDGTTVWELVVAPDTETTERVANRFIETRTTR